MPVFWDFPQSRHQQYVDSAMVAGLAPQLLRFRAVTCFPSST